jgi:YVTN family beta-propeller protein
MRSPVMWKIIVVFLGFAMLISACSGIVSQDADDVSGAIWVADEEGNSITVINAATNKVITTLTGIEGPDNLQVAPDGKTVWAVSGHESLAVMLDGST